MKYYAGIDQGGSKTYAAVCAEDGAIIGAEKGEPPIFYLNDAENSSMKTAYRLVKGIFEGAGRSDSDMSAVCAGLTGVDWDFEYPIHEERTRSAFNVSDIVMLNDCMIAMRAGSEAPNRAVVCAGTGMNVAAKAADGREFIFGYYIIGKTASGSSLGYAAIEAAIDAEAGIGPPTSLTRLIMDGKSYETFEQLFIDKTMGKVHLNPHDYVIGLLKAAAAGDSAAVAIVEETSARTAKFIRAAIKKLGLEKEKTVLIFSGSVYKNVGSVVTDKIIKMLSTDLPLLEYVQARYEPVCGALLTLLDRRYGGSIPMEVTNNFDRGCIKFNLIRE